MDHFSLTVYFIVAVLLALFDFYYGYLAFRRDGGTGTYLGLAAFCAGIVTLSYMYSVFTPSRLGFSIASSVYFSGIDWMLVFLVRFAYRFTKSHLVRRNRLVIAFIKVCAVFDTLVFLVNIFSEISVRYLYRGTEIVAYTYDMRPLYIMHLIYTYSLVALTVFIIVNKAVRTPREYRNQYMLIIAAIGLIVAMNSVFLYFTDGSSMMTMIDHSVLAYSLGLAFMYWAAFQYRYTDMLRALSLDIFQKIGQGIVLFDYTDELIMRNERAEAMLGLELREDLTVKDFLAQTGLPADFASSDDRRSLQCAGAGDSSVRCDYSRLRNRHGAVTGNLFVFTEAAADTDLLTGFAFSKYLRRELAAESSLEGQPFAAAVFDIMGLLEINRAYGRETGDRCIRELAKLIQAEMPEGSLFARGHEADLIVYCPGRSEEELRPCAERVIEGSAEGIGKVVFGLAHTSALPSSGRSEAILYVLRTAGRAAHVKKLQNPESICSQGLTSLVRALRECDSETEAHVERTRRMGEALGRRIALSDAQLADLRLLCLLHDIGKIGIPLEILNKPGKLNEQEWAMLRTHPEKGFQIAVSSDELRPIAEFILFHHERWDGTGYPRKLSGEAIPVLSRIIALVDSYDAMVNDRSYRKAIGPEAAQAEIRRCAGSQFDPVLAGEFLKMLSEDPGIAAGERVDAQEVRFFAPGRAQDPGTGSSRSVEFSRYVLDMDDVVVECDDNFTKITGYSREETEGSLKQSDLIPPEELPHYMVQVGNQFSRGSIVLIDHEVLRKDGSRVSVLCCGKRFFDSALRTFRSEVIITEKQ